jgi:ankyrin repeat protein
LLDAGADKEATDYWGHTALSIAKQADNAEVVKLLLDAGATK